MAGTMVATRRNDFSQHEVIGEGGVGGPGGSGSGPQDNPNDASGSGGNVEGVAPAEVLNMGGGGRGAGRGRGASRPSQVVLGEAQFQQLMGQKTDSMAKLSKDFTDRKSVV